VIESNGVIAVSEKYGLGQVVWSPLAQGVLTGKYSGGKIPKNSCRQQEDELVPKDRIEKKLLIKLISLRLLPMN
jgi:aryl-alcohol dehydrogenase-like predicted oxidoreductase